MFLKAKDWDGRPVNHIQKKMNGYRYQIRQENGIRRIVSKRVDNTEKLRWLQLPEIPDGSILDGELYVPDHNPTDVPTAINEQWNTLSFRPFAIPYWEGEDWKMADVKWVDDFIESIGYASTYFKSFCGETASELKSLAVSFGIEGFVLKEANYCGWWKVKPRPTVDCKVMGIIPGNGKFVGMVGSFIVGAYRAGVFQEIGRISGFTDMERETLSERDIGRIVEVEFQSVGSRGKLIHAAFNRFRDDKEDADEIQEIRCEDIHPDAWTR